MWAADREYYKRLAAARAAAQTAANLQMSSGGYTLQGHTDCVTSCVFSPDGSLLATSSLDKTAKLWPITQ